MSESSWSSVLWVHGDSDTIDGSALLEELLDGPLLGSESEVSNENGVCLTISSSDTAGSSLWLVSTSSLSTEFNPDGSSINVFLVRTSKSFSSMFVFGELNESFSL